MVVFYELIMFDIVFDVDVIEVVLCCFCGNCVVVVCYFGISCMILWCKFKEMEV